MLSGFGNQEWMKKKFEDKRVKVLEDRTKYDDEDRERYDCESIELGGGKTIDDTYEYEQFPYPIEASIRTKKDLDIRDNPKVG